MTGLDILEKDLKSENEEGNNMNSRRMKDLWDWKELRFKYKVYIV